MTALNNGCTGQRVLMATSSCLYPITGFSSDDAGMWLTRPGTVCSTKYLLSMWDIAFKDPKAADLANIHIYVS